jgi:hypothetical protein
MVRGEFFPLLPSARVSSSTRASSLLCLRQVMSTKPSSRAHITEVVCNQQEFQRFCPSLTSPERRRTPMARVIGEAVDLGWGSAF